MGEVEVTLPHSVTSDGTRCRSAIVRPPVGRDEAFLAEEGQALYPAVRTTELLTRCLVALGPQAPVTRSAVAALTVGDREALALHLRRLVFGDDLACVLHCPACMEPMDLSLHLRDLLVTPYGWDRDEHETVIHNDGAQYHVQFRLPTGADQEVAATAARQSEDAGVAILLRRCIQRISKQGAAIEEIPPAVAVSVAEVMRNLDPQAEIILSITCPSCDYVFDVLFDAAAYLCQELVAQHDHLYQQVHVLALHYHWSEAEILGMTARTRGRYLSLLTSSLGDRP